MSKYITTLLFLLLPSFAWAASSNWDDAVWDEDCWDVACDTTCTYSISPTSQNFNSEGGTDRTSVVNTRSCDWDWTATSNDDWISVEFGSIGKGNGTVVYSVLEHTGTSSREGTMTIAGETFTVIQAAPESCNYSLSSEGDSFDYISGTGSINVKASIGCAWTAISDNPDWITIVSGSGSGNGSVSYFIGVNRETGTRTGTITIGTETFTVTQSGWRCAYSTSTDSLPFESAGGTDSVNITATEGCAWTATSSDTSWLTIDSGSSGTGDGTVVYTVLANTSTSLRTGTITIETVTFTIIQLGKDPEEDTIAPIITIDFPPCDTFQVQPYLISGTASDEGSGVVLVEVQIEDEEGGWYVTLDPFAPFTEEPTSLTPTGTTAWSLNTSSVIWAAGFEYNISVTATDGAGNTSTETCKFTFTNIAYDTDLSINLSALRILFGDTLDVSGKITPVPDYRQSMEDLDITIDVTSPSGDTNSYTTSTNEFGQYTRTEIPEFNEEGSWSIQASFVGVPNLYNSSESEATTLLVGESAGYAIIVQGKITSEEGILSHNKTANRIYDKLIERSFIADDIYYLNYDRSQTGVDETPSKAEVQYAIETWALDKLAATPAPLYIILVNHGDVEVFHINNEEITPSDLASWLDNLESGLAASNPIALEKKRIIILGHCFAGSFIFALSNEGRIIITSAAEDEESYKGPSEPDNIRSGEYFLEEFFTELGRGHSLKESFQNATDSTEDYTDQGSGPANTTNLYFDNAVQHPLLDDNGDGVGTNNVTDGSDDGKEAENIIFGSGETYTNAGENPADIEKITGTEYLSDAETSATIWATVNDDSRVDAIWIEVRSPADISLSTVTSVSSEQLELDLPKNFLCYNPSTMRYESDYDDGDGGCADNIISFDSPGIWVIYYFTKDSVTDEISPMVKSTVYKDKSGNNTPGAFGLDSPDNGSEQVTSLVFEWQASTDPDGDNVTYNLLIAEDSLFSNIVYKEEGIITTATIVDEDVVLEDGNVGLSDLTMYYWKIEAVDSYGKVTESTQQWSFDTDNTNYGTGFIYGMVYDETAFAPIEGATISTDASDEALSIAGGYYFLQASAGTYTVTSSYSNYSNEPISDIRVNSGETTELNIPMSNSATSPVPGIKANDSEGTLNINKGDQLRIAVSLDPGSYSGTSADWYIVVYTSSGWQSFNISQMDYSTPDLSALLQDYGLISFGYAEIFSTSSLNKGTYTYYFAVVLSGQLYYDSVTVNVE